MSENFKLFMMLRKKNLEIIKREKLSHKPAEKNAIYDIIDSTTYNIIESSAKFRNKEIDSNILNKELSLNLCFILFKFNPKKNNDDDSIHNNKKDKYCINNHSIYFPTKRITFLEEKKLNTRKNKNNIDNTRIHCLNEKLDVFLPFAMFITKKKNKNKKIKDISINSNSDNNLKNSSFISEESLTSIMNFSFENNYNNYESNKIQKNFVKYGDLVDYIECPLVQKKSNKDKINDFIYLLNKIDDIIESEEINQKNEMNINNNEKIIKFNFDNSKKNEIKGKIPEISNDNKHLSINNKPINVINKDQEIKISSSLKKKYLRKMNDNYIHLIYNIYMKLWESYYDQKKKEKNNNNLIKSAFLKILKQLLLEKGISNRLGFEKIYKNYIFCDGFISFEKFIQSFDVIIYDKALLNMIQKYIFLLNILTDQVYLDSNDIKTFFELIGSYSAYIEGFSENLGEKLIKRYNAVYNNEEKNNITEKKYNVKKMRIILESFFDKIKNYE